VDAFVAATRERTNLYLKRIGDAERSAIQAGLAIMYLLKNARLLIETALRLAPPGNSAPNHLHRKSSGV